ncbi:hypothetical protein CAUPRSCDRAFT_10725 [Caulochytrium protostelioides]|uniref:Uncharacterized protein n=1 Tax=Caulochytrium protostelioides TaxID=1555241 RepID=A0A4P9WW27_9FUNG|nr:hypothetical protein CAUPRSCDRAFT_10725 [Caulochytrium protostelioides]
MAPSTAMATAPSGGIGDDAVWTAIHAARTFLPRRLLGAHRLVLGHDAVAASAAAPTVAAPGPSNRPHAGRGLLGAGTDAAADAAVEADTAAPVVVVPAGRPR